MTSPTQAPYVLRMEAAVTIEVLVYADDPDDAHNLLHGELGDDLNDRLRSFFKDPDSPYVIYDHADRPALYTEVHGDPTPGAYPPLLPNHPTLIRDPDDDAFDLTADDIPDYLDFGDDDAA